MGVSQVTHCYASTPAGKASGYVILRGGQILKTEWGYAHLLSLPHCSLASWSQGINKAALWGPVVYGEEQEA